MRLGGRLPCITSSSVYLKSELSDGNTSSCLPLFPIGQHVNRFQAVIILPTCNLTVYLVGVLTSPHVDCGDPMTVVMSESEDNGGQYRRQRQCSREPRYDAFRDSEPQSRTCVFQCFNYELCDLEVTVTVQFMQPPWINEDNKLAICEI